MSHKGKKGQPPPRTRGGVRAPYTYAVKLRLAREVVDREQTITAVSKYFGVSLTTLAEWVKAYREGGASALQGQATQPKAGSQETVAQKTVRSAVLSVREEHPEFGSRRIRDILA